MHFLGGNKVQSCTFFFKYRHSDSFCTFFSESQTTQQHLTLKNKGFYNINRLKFYGSLEKTTLNVCFSLKPEH